MRAVIRVLAAAATLVVMLSPPGPLGGPSTVLGAGQAPAVSMVADEGEAARYWPRWRGPSGQGLVTDSGYPDRWSATENVLWKTPIPGSGNSSPIVWRDRILLTTAYEGGRRLSVLAFRRSDGTRLWETFAPEGRQNRGTHYKNGHASATPATDGERVYASFGTRGLLALDMDGKIVWQRDLGQMDAYHGTAGSPLLYKDRLILYQDQFSGSFIAAFDTRTGQQLWRTSRDASVGWGTPIAVRVGDHDEIIVNSQHRVHAYDPATGRELWRCGGSTYEVIPTPVVGYGMVFCSSGRAGPTLAIRPGGRGRRHPHSPGVDEPERVPVRAFADPVRRVSLHGERYGEHRHVPRREDRASRVARTARRRAPGRIFGVTGRGRRQGLLYERRG